MEINKLVEKAAMKIQLNYFLRTTNREEFKNLNPFYLVNYLQTKFM